MACVPMACNCMKQFTLFIVPNIEAVVFQIIKVYREIN